MLKNKKLEVFFITVGSAFEWFDYIVYISLSSYLSSVFFPDTTAKKGLLLIFLIFSIAYLARPIGGIVLGAMSDKFGRKRTFLISTSLMAVATLGIACLPSYFYAGAASFILLLLFRLIQAFSVGGEYTTGVAYLSEKSIDRRGFISSFFIFSTIFGVLLAFLFTSWMKNYFSHNEIVSWAWRIPFFLSFAFIVLNVLFRSLLTPSEVFKEAKESGKLLKNPMSFVIKHHKKLILLIVLYAAFPEVAVYSYITMMPTLISKYSGINYSGNMLMKIFPLIILITMLPIFGAISDKASRIKQYLISMIAFTLLSFTSVVIFRLNPNDIVLILLISALMGSALAANNSTLPATLSEQANTRMRCSTFGIGYNLATAIFGGTTPLIAEYLSQQGGFYFSFYLIFVLILSVIGISFFKDKRSLHIDHEDTGELACQS